MLKNKKAVYVLLPVVLLIWGTIGWKIFTAVRGENNSAIAADSNTAEQTPVVVPDTFSLLLNYRDPFSGKTETAIAENSHSSVKSTGTSNVAVSTPVSANWPQVSYMGLIRKTGSDQPLALVSVNGNSFLVHAGDKAGDVLIQKVWSDSVEVSWGKERKRVRK